MAGIVQNVIRAPESTQNVPQNPARAIREVDPGIAYLEPDAAPLTVILMRAGSKVASNPKFEWQEKDLSARWDAINNGAGYNATASPITVDNGKFFSIGDIVEVVRTNEKMLVTGVSTNSLTVVRAIDGDGTTGQAILDNDDLLIIGNAYPEGSLSGAPKSVQEDVLFNYTQIVRTPFGATRTEQNTDNYTGKPRAQLRYEKGIEHKIDLERTCLFGERNLFTSGSDTADNPRRLTGGLFYLLQNLTNTAKIKDFGGLVSEPELEDWLQDVFNIHGASTTRTFVHSPLWGSILDQLAMGRVQVVDKANTYGVAVRQFVTSHGTLMLIKHTLLENSPVPAGVTGGPFGYADKGLALDLTRISYRPLQGGTTKLITDIQAPDYDGFKDEYLTEMGWSLKNAKVHGIAKNATG